MIINGDCLKEMKKMKPNSIDAIVTDPPYGLEFMGKEWDKVPLQQFSEDWSKQALRVLKPGGHMLSFGGTRTYHRMVCGIEDAGFEIRDCVMWIYGSGFPKSLNIGKAVDKLQGNEREVVGDNINHREVGSKGLYRKGATVPKTITKGTSEWECWGTALKPAVEPIVLSRKPLKGTVAQNVLKYGTGGLNIDGCRIESEGIIKIHGNPDIYSFKPHKSLLDYKDNVKGRFPSNVILDEVCADMLDEQSGISVTKPHRSKVGGTSTGIFGMGPDEAYTTYDDKGGASRFFYVAKVSSEERNMGSDNNHPTVKPVELLKHLVKMITPKGGTVLDPFMGSGSTGIACKELGFDFIGIEKEKEYCDIAKARIGSFDTLEEWI